MELGGCLRIEYRFDHKHQFSAVFVAVNHRRCVFGLRRNKADCPGDGIGDAVHVDRHVVALMQRANERFRHKGADLDVLRRQERHDRPARFDPFALAI